jgi:hypothetical protein
MLINNDKTTDRLLHEALIALATMTVIAFGAVVVMMVIH